MRLHRSRGQGHDAGLSADDDADWPAAVRRLAAKVEHSRGPEPRKAKSQRRNEDPEHLKRIARVKSWGVPY